MNPSTDRPLVGVYPGTFDPVTVAHMAIARAALDQLGLSRLDLTISASTLGKDDTRLTPIDERLAELTAVTSDDPRLAVRSTTSSLIVDIATDYDVLVVGGDKWAQVLDPEWYGGTAARDEALRRLPMVALAPRHPWIEPGDDPLAGSPAPVTLVVLDLDPAHREVSATAVRTGRTEWRARPRGQ
ncbi:MAG: hypothetical protein EBX39_11815 [Actinobacteria bacterium]|nr:hypothetical protein [Actinomycetota bacterium]